MTLGLLPNLVNSAALRYFYEVARYGSFQTVEEKVHVAASAIRRQVQLLEEELGVKLFVRDRNVLKLTSAGETLFYRVQRVMWELNTARTEIGLLQGEQTGHVRIGINETVAREFLANFLGEFRERNPKVTFDVSINSSNLLAETLHRGDVDIIMGYALEPQVGLKQVAALNLTTCITVHKHHPLASREFVRIGDLAYENLIMPNDDQRLRHILNSLFAEVSIKPNFSVTTNSFEFIAIMVAKGLGVGCQIRVRPGSDPARSDIVYVPIREPGIESSVLACYISDTYPANMAVSFCVKALQKSLHDWGDNEMDLTSSEAADAPDDDVSGARALAVDTPFAGFPGRDDIADALRAVPGVDDAGRSVVALRKTHSR